MKDLMFLISKDTYTELLQKQKPPVYKIGLLRTDSKHINHNLFCIIVSGT